MRGPFVYGGSGCRCCGFIRMCSGRWVPPGAQRSARLREKPLSLSLVPFGSNFARTQARISLQSSDRLLCPAPCSVGNLVGPRTRRTFAPKGRRCTTPTEGPMHLRSQGQKVYGPAAGIREPSAETPEGARPRQRNPCTFGRNPKRCMAAAGREARQRSARRRRESGVSRLLWL